MASAFDRTSAAAAIAAVPATDLNMELLRLK